ncbi:GAF domain-containing protein [Salinibacterium xinjiangense]|nr:GAF domain-containing protein [Salinibacterium xinjiangense]
MTSIYRWRSLVASLPVRPVDEPVSHAPGLDPDRVLIIGNGLAVGWGVLIHDLALPGFLSRALSAATGRGSEVRAHIDPDITIATAQRALSASDLASYDAVVVVIGASDAFQLISPRRWAHHMAVLFRALEQSAGAAPILIVGIPPISSIPFFRAHPGGIIDRWAKHLNSITRKLCDAHRTISYVAPVWAVSAARDDIDGRTDRYRSPEEYRSATATIMDALLPLLETATALAHHIDSASGSAQSNEARMAALGRLEILDTPTEVRFDYIVRMVRTMFGTESAAFTLIDADRQWSKAVLGTSQREIPLEHSFCALTIQSPTPFVVLDARHDERPLPATDVRFYAGYPVEAPDGTRIGAICVFDSRPRSSVTTAQLSFLRELAFSIQREIA